MEKKLEYFRIGKIVKTRGLKGELKIYSHTDNMDRFRELDCFYIGEDRDTKYYVEKSNIISGNMATIKMKGFDTIESVQGFIQKFIYVDRGQSYELDEDEMFISDMLGMSVETESGEKIGTLVDVLQYSANDVYVVKSESSKEYLIPATYSIVPVIDKDKNLIIVKPIPGLLD
ncbi:ribosome maturation factor RimM [Peptostreptococcus faecalis]|uniref:ribosome maturation factor RimM n=1 Tax=Peptostreptococcus faecalis TaxID=2045015 RepID=UPI000C7BC923|nr:ribosome maturation factor RimM [Peptostreptococcus faecalis]